MQPRTVQIRWSWKGVVLDVQQHTLHTPSLRCAPPNSDISDRHAVALIATATAVTLAARGDLFKLPIVRLDVGPWEISAEVTTAEVVTDLQEPILSTGGLAPLAMAIALALVVTWLPARAAPVQVALSKAGRPAAVYLPQPRTTPMVKKPLIEAEKPPPTSGAPTKRSPTASTHGKAQASRPGEDLQLVTPIPIGSLPDGRLPGRSADLRWAEDQTGDLGEGRTQGLPTAPSPSPPPSKGFGRVGGFPAAAPPTLPVTPHLSAAELSAWTTICRDQALRGRLKLPTGLSMSEVRDACESPEGRLTTSIPWSVLLELNPG